MSLSKVNHLYRVRVLFDHERHITLVETVNRDVVLENGVPMEGPPKETARAYTKDDLKLSVAIGMLVDEIERVGKDMEVAEAARLQRLADEAAQRQADEDRRAKEAAEAVAAEAPRKKKPART